MDPALDNPLKRFSSFWTGLLVFVLFGLACLVVVPLLGGKKEDPMDAAASKRRHAIKDEMQAAQKAVLDPAAVRARFDSIGGNLLAMNPAPVKAPLQVVPGSPTAEKLAADTAPPPEVEELAADAPVDPAVLESGKGQYVLCMACHGANGEGVPNIAPPLAGSEWVLGPVQNLIRIQLRGLMGPITVAGTDYNLPAPMVAQAFQTDDQVAAVLTYVRNSFGNKASPVTPEMVKALRGEVGKPPLTVADLIPPAGDKPAGTAPPPAKPTPAPAKPTPVPAKPTPVPAKPTPAPAKPTPVPVKPTPAPAGSDPAAGAPVDPAVMAAGKGQYVLCLACHGIDGNGVPNIAPPLAGSEWVNGPAENLIRIQLRGLMGPITVKGKEYKLPAPMVAQAFQTDDQVAAVLTYVRNSFGNKASPVTPEMVKALRGEVGKPPLTVADLIPPTGDKPGE